MNAKSKVLHKLSASGKIILKKARRLTPKEQAEKTKDWPRAVPGREYGMKAQMGRHEENLEHQRRFGRAWND